MSEGGWSEPEQGWGEDGRRREELPQLENLPIAEQGYDREAVREAFDSFYRHAAQLDSTLRILEGVEVFGREARELRADIRSLRAASWGPAPSARHVWSVGHEVWSPQEPPAAFAASLPRLAVWAALIVAVGVGAALAELSTALIVVLVVAAWALVALIEVALASRRAGAVPVPLAPGEPVEAAVEPEREAVATPQETVVVPAAEAEAAREPEPAEPEAELVEAEPEPEPEPVPVGQPPRPWRASRSSSPTRMRSRPTACRRPSRSRSRAGASGSGARSPSPSRRTLTRPWSSRRLGGTTSLPLTRGSPAPSRRTTRSPTTPASRS